MKSFKEILEHLGFIPPWIQWVEIKQETNFKKLIDLAIEEEKDGFVCYCLHKFLTFYQKVALSVFVAEQTIEYFEKEFPDDKRPRLALEAAKGILSFDSDIERNNCLLASKASKAAKETARNATGRARDAANSCENAALIASGYKDYLGSDWLVRSMISHENPKEFRLLIYNYAREIGINI